MRNTIKSEFGKGLCYCLGLFLAHERIVDKDSSHRNFSLFFYSAADHIFEFDVDNVPKGLRLRCKRFKAKVLFLRLPMDKEKEATKEDYYWAIDEAKDLLRLIDKANRIKTIKAEWE